MKQLGVVICIVCFGFSGLAQLQTNHSEKIKQLTKADSLLSVLKNLEETKTKADALNALCEELTRIGQFENAKVHSAKAISLSQTLHYGSALIKAYNYSGNCYFRTGDNAEALKLFFKAVKEAEGYNDKDAMAKSYNSVSNVYTKLGNYKEGLRYVENARKIYETLGEKKKLSVCIDNIGVINQSMNNYEEALKNHFSALRIKEEIKDSAGIGWSYYNITILFGMQEIYDEAEKYCLSCIKIMEAGGNLSGLSGALGNLTNIYLEQKKYPEALKACEKSNSISRQINFKEAISATEKMMSEIYEINGDAKSALAHYKIYTAIKDSVDNDEVNKRIVEVELNHKFDKLLEKERTEEYKKEIIAGEKLKQQKFISFFLAIGGVMVIGLVFFVIVSSRRKIKAAVIITQQQKEITRQEAKITGQMEERKRLAMELHDGLGGTLSAIKLHLENISPSKQTSDDIKKAIDHLSSACKEVRNISHNLAPASLSDMVLTEALYDLVKKFNVPGKLEIGFECFPETEINQLKDEIKNEVFRIVQECLNNIVNHSGANKGHIGILKENDQVYLSMEDNGKGFDISLIKKGMGIKNMESRINALKGEFTIDSIPGRGTAINIKINCNEQ